MWFVFRALLFLALLFPSAVMADNHYDYAYLVNVSGKQRMLSQKMAKEIMLIAHGVDTEKNIELLEKTRAEYDSVRKGLWFGENGTNIPKGGVIEIKDEMGRVNEAFFEVSSLVDEVLYKKAASKADVEKLLSYENRLLDRSNDVVSVLEGLYLEKGSGQKGVYAKELNLAGRQRMLTQRMFKRHLISLYFPEDERWARLQR